MRQVAALALECRKCEISYETGFHPRCERCGGPTDVYYDLKSATVDGESYYPYERYFDLIPIRDRHSLKWDGAGNTPLIHAQRLGAAVGLTKLYLKNEGANPTRSTKDRIATISLAFLRERGVTQAVISSTGNSSTAFGAMAPMFPDIHLHIFCGESFVQRLNFSDSPNVTVYKVEGSFVAAGKAARQFASRQGFTPEAGFFNPARREGLKLAYLEAFDEMPLQPSVVIQAVSSGMGLYGAQKGIDEYLALGRLTVAPRIVCAQQQTCSPMYNGWRDGVTQLGDEYVIPNPEGLAEAILRGDARDTYPYMRRIVESSGGCFEIANEAEILRARKMAFELEDLDICNASSVALAVAFRLARRGWIDKEEAVLVNLTGADRASNLVPTVIDYG